jgi:hypothetical protein
VCVCVCERERERERVCVCVSCMFCVVSLGEVQSEYVAECVSMCMSVSVHTYGALCRCGSGCLYMHVGISTKCGLVPMSTEPKFRRNVFFFPSQRILCSVARLGPYLLIGVDLHKSNF